MNTTQNVGCKVLSKKRHRISSNKSTQINLPEILLKDIDSYQAKPWQEAKADQSDYFNYGFNSETWEKYQLLIKERLAKLQRLTETKDIVLPEDKKENKLLFDYLPLEFGGIDEVYDEVKYNKVNFFNYKHNKKNYIPVLSLKKAKEPVNSNKPYINLNIRPVEEDRIEQDTNSATKSAAKSDYSLDNYEF